MKIDIDRHNPTDHDALHAMAHDCSSSIETAVATPVHSAIEECRSTLEALRAHLAEGETQANKGQYVTQSIEDILTEFKAGMHDEQFLPDLTR